jgi:hypothetical protein
MACDCSRVGLDEIFTGRVARRDARRFRRRGIDERACRLLDSIEAVHPVKDAHTLEVGAGIGALSIELLGRGAASAVMVDAAPASVAVARQLADDCDVGDRLTIIEGDFTAFDATLPGADIVILDRVVCCYPEGPALLAQAAGHARAVVAISYPRDVWWTRWLWGAANFGQTLLRRRFRLFLHEPDYLQRVLRDAGFAPRVVGDYWPWELVVAEAG